MLVFKLSLIALTVYLSSLAARRGGHAVAGLVTGLPMIVGPIIAILLVDQGPVRVREVSLATLVCLPATLLHGLVFAHASRRLRWPSCLALATAAYLSAASLLLAVALPPWAVCLLAAAAPGLVWRAMPQTPPDAASVRIPAAEVVLRMAAAVALAATILAGADVLPAGASGVLLALPIAGAVLPCFTLPRYGHAATARLLRGVALGLHGFCAFFIVLVAVLPAWHPAAAFIVALLAAPAAARLAIVCIARLSASRAAGRPAVTDDQRS